MCERSIYLRDQAEKCERHASALTDAYTQVELRKLAAEYVARAVVIENKEQAYDGLSREDQATSVTISD